MPAGYLQAAPAELEPDERERSDLPIYEEPVCRFVRSALDCPDQYGWIAGERCAWNRTGGRTWGELQPSDIPNPGSKFRLFRLSDGRIVLVHNPNPQTTHPNSKHYAQCNRNPLALWVSDDDLRTWGHRRVLTDYPGHLAYPDGVVDEREEYVHFAFAYNRHDVIYWGAPVAVGGGRDRLCPKGTR